MADQPTEERFDVVDDRDWVIGTASRAEVHSQGHIHRSVLFFLVDREGRVFVNQRTAAKEFYPEYWSIVFGGHVHAGETYEVAVCREAAEEAGVDAAPVYLDSFQKRFDAVDRENVRVFAFVVDEQPTLDPAEVQQGSFMTLAGLARKLEAERFLPETAVLLPILRRWLALRPQM